MSKDYASAAQWELVWEAVKAVRAAGASKKYVKETVDYYLDELKKDGADRLDAHFAHERGDLEEGVPEDGFPSWAIEAIHNLQNRVAQLEMAEMTRITQPLRPIPGVSWENDPFPQSFPLSGTTCQCGGSCGCTPTH